MRLYLAEKRQQGEVIAKFLDPSANTDNKGGFIRLSSGDLVSWCRGHLYELAQPDEYDPKWRSWELEVLPIIPQRWKLIPKLDAEQQRLTINKLLYECDETVLCTDFDREGQYLGMNAIYEAGISDLSHILRAKLTALDTLSLKRAFSDLEPVEKSMSLYYSALARSHSDWLVGMNLTRLYTCLGRNVGCDGVVNLGRVITPAAALVAHRDAQIANFKSEDYYEIYADLIVQHGQFRAKWQPSDELKNEHGYVTDHNKVEAVAERLHGGSFSITGVERKTVQENPPLPFSLTELQAYCASHLGLTPSQTLKVVQSLYDRQYVSYPRTDCRYIPKSQHADAKMIFKALASDPGFTTIVNGCNPDLVSRAFDDKKFEGHSHNAIIPTSTPVDLKTLEPNEAAVYDVVRRYYCAQFYAPADYDVLRVSLKCQGENFTATGRTLRVPGYRVIFAPDTLKDIDSSVKAKEQKDFATSIPQLSQGEAVSPKEINIENKKTRPPKHYTMASLTRAMESIGSGLITDESVKNNREMTDFLKKHGIGTAATRAQIIDNLFKYGWCVTEDNCVIATQRAHEILSALPGSIKSPETTALWEDGLNRIAQMDPRRAPAGAQAFERKITEVVGELISRCTDKENQKIIEGKLSKAGSLSSKHETTEYKCPQCGKPLRRFKGKYGIFWGCHECKATFQDLNGKPLLQPEKNVPRCPKCGKPLRLIKSKKGALWWICQDKENCDYIVADLNGRPAPEEKCPACGSALKRCQSKNGSWFWVCTNKSCGKFFDDLGGQPLLEVRKCPKCGREMRLATRDKNGKAVAPYFYCTGYKEGCYCKVDKYGKILPDPKPLYKKGHKEK